MRTATCALVLGALFASACQGGDPTMCTNVQCKPPTCCGDSCSSNSDCCDETVCSTDGRCIPYRCTGCGEVGCVVDYDACTAECARPASCNEACTSNADCAVGAECRANVNGGMQCVPVECDRCGGLTPICHVANDCGTTCTAPARCGQACTPGEDCGAAAVCHTFTLVGTSYCVPMDFASVCSACGDGCTFHSGTCDISCGVHGIDAGTSAGSDAGRPMGGRDAGTPPVGADAGGTITPPPPETPSCLACCTPCTSDDQCCDGTSCIADETGARKCYPSECQYCSYGCTFHCP